MAQIEYDEVAADAFEANRQLPLEGLEEWRKAIAHYLAPRPSMRVLDLGAGTGMWATALTRWYGVDVLAVEPSKAMRDRSSYPAMRPGDATSIPADDSSLDGAWVSTVIHHIPDLSAAALELRRVLRPGAPILIRSAFPGRHRQITLFRYFPEAIRALEAYPTVADVCFAFATAGFSSTALEGVPQVTAQSLAAVAARLCRNAHTPLRLITDKQYDAGAARLRTAARTTRGPVIDTLDLLVLNRNGITPIRTDC